MLNDGDRGAVLQRDKKTYAVAPHIPCGLITADLLRKLADAADKYHAAAIKITNAQRIALIGIAEEDIDAVWKDLGVTPEPSGHPHTGAASTPQPGYMTGSRIRSIRACPGTAFCKRARLDSLSLGLELDRRYIAKPLPGKMKIGVSGCGNQCSETAIKDIGLVAGLSGWNIYVGGMAGNFARLADLLSYDEFPTDLALDLVDQLITFYEKTARPHERLGELIDRISLKSLQLALNLPPT